MFRPQKNQNPGVQMDQLLKRINLSLDPKNYKILGKTLRKISRSFFNIRISATTSTKQ